MKTHWEYRMPTKDGWSEWKPLTPEMQGVDEILEDGTLIRAGKKVGWIAEQKDTFGMYRKVNSPLFNIMVVDNMPEGIEFAMVGEHSTLAVSADGRIVDIDNKDLPLKQ